MTKEYLIPIVDEQDTITAYKRYCDVLPQDIYRVTGLWVTNDSGEILLAQRAFTKKKDPGCWGPAVAGTVEKHETYDTNIIKEIEEEIGISKTSPRLLAKYRVQGSSNYFCSLYHLKINQPITYFKTPADEVEQLAWATPDKIIEDVKHHPEKYIPSFMAILEHVKQSGVL